MYRKAKINVFAKNTLKTPRFSAHRGSQAFGPENSIVSFTEAGKHAVWAIETDFRMTKDGVVVCLHDENLDRTTTGKGKVADHTFAELQKLKLKEVNSSKIANKQYKYRNFKDSDLRIPTMEEYFDICAQYGCVPFIELKEDGGLIAKMMESIRRHGLEGSCVISSNNIDLLKTVRRQGCLELIHLIFAKMEDLSTMQQLGNAAVAFNIQDYSKSIKDKYVFPKHNPATPKQFVKILHKMGFRVCLRAIDTPEAVRLAVDAKLDYLPTNTMWPSRMKE